MEIIYLREETTEYSAARATPLKGKSAGIHYAWLLKADKAEQWEELIIL